MVMALKTFERKFMDLLHAPLDEDDIDNLMTHQQHVLARMSRDPHFDDAEDLMLLS
jgi:hypothetical protein